MSAFNNQGVARDIRFHIRRAGLGIAEHAFKRVGYFARIEHVQLEKLRLGILLAAAQDLLADLELICRARPHQDRASAARLNSDRGVGVFFLENGCQGFGVACRHSVDFQEGFTINHLSLISLLDVNFFQDLLCLGNLVSRPGDQDGVEALVDGDVMHADFGRGRCRLGGHGGVTATTATKASATAAKSSPKGERLGLGHPIQFLRVAQQLFQNLLRLAGLNVSAFVSQRDGLALLHRFIILKSLDDPFQVSHRVLQHKLIGFGHSHCRAEGSHHLVDFLDFVLGYQCLERHRVELFHAQHIDIVDATFLALLIEVIVDLAGTHHDAPDRPVGDELDLLIREELGVVPEQTVE